MGAMAVNLTDAEMRDVSAYFAAAASARHRTSERASQSETACARAIHLSPRDRRESGRTRMRLVPRTQRRRPASGVSAPGRAARTVPGQPARRIPFGSTQQRSQPDDVRGGSQAVRHGHSGSGCVHRQDEVSRARGRAVSCPREPRPIAPRQEQTKPMQSISAPPVAAPFTQFGGASTRRTGLVRVVGALALGALPLLAGAQGASAPQGASSPQIAASAPTVPSASGATANVAPNDPPGEWRVPPRRATTPIRASVRSPRKASLVAGALSLT